MLLYEDKKNSISAVLRTGLSCLPHLHSHIEVGFVTEGNTQLTVDDAVYDVTAGDAFLIFPNRIHSFEDSGSISCYLLICSVNDASPFTDIFKQHLPESPVIRPIDADALEKVFSVAAKHGRALELCPDAPYAAERVRAYAPSVLAELVPAASLVPSDSADPDATQRILLYCDTHYRDELSLDLLSSKLGYSKYYISHIFSTNIKIGFSRYLRSLRVTAAKRLIRHSDMSMTEISSESGFSSIRTFNRQFYEETGLTPTEYAKKRRVKA